MFLVWSFEPWGQLMLPDGHCLSVFAAGMVNTGQCGLVGQWVVSSRETRTDLGGGGQPSGSARTMILLTLAGAT